MELPLISVIVPIYKVEPYFDKCISSVVNQTYTNLEIILVDDGSPDQCPQMCDAWAEKDARIRVIHKENGGLSDARNAGMAVATGELMTFVDSDDWIDSDMYKHLYQRMVEDHSDIAACGVQMVWEDGTPPRILTCMGNHVLSKEEAMQAIIEESWLKQPVWYKLYKTNLIKDILFPVGKYHEDVFWSYQAVDRANKISVSDHIGYYYFQRSGSIMGKGFSARSLDCMEATKERYMYVANHYTNLIPSAYRSLFSIILYSCQCALKLQDTSERNLCLKQILDCYQFFCQQPVVICSVKDRIWLSMSHISLRFTGYIRNFLGVGV